MRSMIFAGAALLLLPLMLTATPAMAEGETGSAAPGPAGDTGERPRALVTGITPDRDVDPGFVRVLDDVFLARVRTLDRFEVISSNEIAQLLDIDTQRQLLGCVDETCVSEIGDAVGANYAISGSVSRLGDDLSLTLRLFDIDAVRVVRHLSESLPANEVRASRQMRIAADRLLALPLTAPLPPPPEAPRPWYRKGWVWGGAAGVAVVGAAAGGFLLLQPGPNLGTVTLDE